MFGLAQVRGLGLTRGAIEHRLASGAWVRRHRGVYALAGAPIGPRGRAFAAVLAGGPGGVLSHRSAGGHWCVRPEPSVPEITTPGRRGRSRADLVVHSAALERGDIRVRAGIPVTSPERTLLDLAAVDPIEAVERAVSEAQVRGLVGPGSLRAIAARVRGHHGVRALLLALDGPGGAPSESELERAMARLIRDAGLPQPRAQMTIAGHRADFAWPEQRVILETDGYAAHGNRLAFERDRLRDQEHVLAGWTVVRVTWRQVTERPLETAARLGALLRRG